jgi:acyl-coenzyme A thioesterase PaaI-like protein
MAGDTTPLQDRGWLPTLTCFGCGSTNEHGIRLKSIPHSDGSYRGTWSPAPHHEGPPGVLHGGMIAVPMDCHAAWIAVDVFRQRAAAAGEDPSTIAAVTGEYHVRLHAPTPISGPVELHGTAGEPEGRRVEVVVTSSVAGTTTATFTGTMFLVPMYDV